MKCVLLVGPVLFNMKISNIHFQFGIEDAVALVLLNYAVQQITLVFLGKNGFIFLGSFFYPIIVKAIILPVLTIFVVLIFVFHWNKSILLKEGPTGFGLFGFGRSDVFKGLIGGCLAFAFSAMVIVFLGFVIKIPSTDIHSYFAERALAASGMNVVIIILSAILVSPIAEELLYRGALFSLLVRRIGIISSSVIVTIIFVASHYWFLGGSERLSPLSLIELSGLGAILIVVKMHSKSIWSCVITHALYNALCLCMILSL